MSSLVSVILIGLSTIITGAINYAYHPIMLRNLPINTFAEFESLVGIFNVLWVITASISLFLVKEIVKHSDAKMYAKFVFVRGGKWLLWIGLLSYGIYLALSPVTMYVLHIDEFIPVMLAGSFLLLSFSSTPASVVMQALEKFGFIASNNVIASSLRLLFWWGFVCISTSLTLSVTGFLGASLVGSLITFVYASMLLRNVPLSPSGVQEEIIQDVRREIPNLGHFFALSVCLAILMNMDVILAPTFFDKASAGAYCAISILAKFIIFIIGAIDTVYYPKIIGEKKREKIWTHCIHAGLLMLVAIGIGFLGIEFFGYPILAWLKPGFESHQTLLAMLLWAFGLFGIITFYVKILVAKKYSLASLGLLFWGVFFLVVVIARSGSGDIEYAMYVIVAMILSILLTGLFVFFQKNMQTKSNALSL